MMDDIQALLGVELDEPTRKRVEVYVKHAKQAIMVYIGPYVADDSVFPEGLEYLVAQMVLAKYNKFHNEGMTSVSEEGLTLTFRPSDLDGYTKDLQSWIDQQPGSDTMGEIVGW